LRGALGLIWSGAEFLARALLGRARLPVPRAVFALAVLRAVRPHYFAFPAAAALSGASAAGRGDRPGTVALAAVAAAVAWGVGQLLNDLGDVESDRHDAPDRPAVTGELPAAPAAAVALVLGVMVAVALGSVHPRAWLLVLSSALCLLAYPLAKPLPVLGNLAHGALMGTVSVIGFAAARPELGLAEIGRAAWPIALVTGASAALYLQANYEKDRAGDALAGVRTLAHVLGIRASALVRGAGVLGLAYWMVRLGLVAGPSSLALAVGATCVVTLSAARALLGNDEASALAGYRWAIHGTTALLLAPAVPMLGSLPSLGFLTGAALLVERAFSRSPNP
jgi:4-hydroxybenzoate polyprenyltransferase